MTDKTAPRNDEFVLPQSESPEAPRHGFRGDWKENAPAFPWGLTIAISREAGARGTSIAKRAAGKLNWQIYTQDLIEYIAQEGTFRQEVFDNLPATAGIWVDAQMNRLLKEQSLSGNPSILDLARIVLSLGAPGEVVLLGRGAGCILPARSTLNVRLVAPLAGRVAYMAQWLRLTEDEAAEEVQKRDDRRIAFMATHFHRESNDVHQYDMVLNSSFLGEERCAELIIQAAHAKAASLTRANEL